MAFKYSVAECRIVRFLQGGLEHETHLAVTLPDHRTDSLRLHPPSEAAIHRASSWSESAYQRSGRTATTTHGPRQPPSRRPPSSRAP